MRARWREILFLSTVLILLAFYVSRPQRSAQWNRAWSWWVSISNHARSFRSAQEAVMDWTRYETTDIAALATFDGIEYLGCDTTMAFDDERKPQQRLVTYWRGDQLEAEAYSVCFRVSDARLGFRTEIESSLILEDGWARASIPLSETGSPRSQVWVQLRNPQGDFLSVESTIFATERGSGLLVWQRRQKDR